MNKNLLLLLIVSFIYAGPTDTIPVVIIQHSMREKPYNDTLVCSWFRFQDDTVSNVEYRDNSVKVFQTHKGRNYYSRRFYTVLKIPVKHIVLILRGDQWLKSK